ncbi:TIGR03862 family flavoprotein [Bradyrhizobium neotropicale]|nr:TIGR03862 family flavoprotein [Bradyrhizobium neotropicale]MBO4224886.1 TIGR03862 family flavoprotein [Bradyrhizobium neotropicale]
MPSAPHQVAVIGAGPAGLMAAEVLAQAGALVTIYDAMPSAGRKFLMAGRGGLNLTHSEPLPKFLARYREAMPHLEAAIEAFPPQALRDWSEALGQPTFVGSSGRVFPKAFKASPVLRAWLRRLDGAAVRLLLRHRWSGWDNDGRLLFQTPEGTRAVEARATILALGGASWPRLGSDGSWVDVLATKGIKISPLRPANSGFIVAWSDIFRDRFEGQPLKSVALSIGGQTVRGEAIVTRTGIEGGAIYALSADLREAILRDGEATLAIALRPDLSVDELAAKLSTPKGKQSFSNFLRKTANLSPVAIGLLQEAAKASGQSLPSLPPADLARLLNAVPLRLSGTAPIARAISTAGGIAFDELDDNFMLHRLPGIFAAGEMLDWEAPTGGYLLQASFATGAAVGKGVMKWLDA